MQPSLPATSGTAQQTSRQLDTLPSAPQSGSRIPPALMQRIPVERRRGKRYASRLPTAPARGTVRQQTAFSKKLFVFQCMDGPSCTPRSFTRRDKDIIARGFVSDISVDATEEQVRDEIHAVLLNSDLPNSIGPRDFEFIDVNGKVAFVPSIKEGFEFNGRIVKQLAGAGSLYIRLLRKLQPSVVISDSSDEESLPPLPFKCRRIMSRPDDEPPQLPTEVQNLPCADGSTNFVTQSTGTVTQSTSTVEHPPTELPSCTSSENEQLDLVRNSNWKCDGSDNVNIDDIAVQTSSETVLSAGTRSQATVGVGIDDSTVQASASTETVMSRRSQVVVSVTAGDLNACNNLPGPSKRPGDIQQLQEAFPNFPIEFILMFYSISDDFVATLECLLKGDLHSVLSFMKDHVLKNNPTAYNSPIIHAPAEEKD